MESDSESESSFSRGECPFSLEIVAQFLFYLDPIDIAHMRQACRLFHKAASSKIVWKAALELVIQRHGIFSPTFPLDDMSVEELEHAASGPFRFVDNIEKNWGDRYRAYQDRVFFPLKSSDEIHTADKMTLVPGGRFLVTTGDSSLCLWDLGYSYAAPIDPYPVASLEDQGLELEDVCPGADGDEIIVAVRSIDNDTDVLTIYAIDPTAEEPRFTEEAKFKFPSQNLANMLFPHGTPTGDGRLNSAHLNKEFAFVYCQPFFVVWNWVEGTAARWSLDDPLEKIYVCDQAIITCDGRGAFGVFDMPTWLKPAPHRNCSQIPDIRLNPRGSFGHPSQAPGRLTFAGTPTWQQRTGIDPYLCLLTDEKPMGRHPVTNLYSIRRIGKPLGDSFLPSCLPAAAGVSWTTYGSQVATRYDSGASSLFHCADKLVMCTRSTKSTFMATLMSRARESSRNDLMPMSAILTAPVKLPEGPFTGKQFGFCPMSGRLVYAVVREDADEGPETEIHVCDYLLPLEYQGQTDD